MPAQQSFNFQAVPQDPFQPSGDLETELSLTDLYRIHMEILRSDDTGVKEKLKALEMGYNLHGVLKAAKPEVPGDIVIRWQDKKIS